MCVHAFVLCLCISKNKPMKSSVLLSISNNKSLTKLIMADPRDADVDPVGIGRRQRENVRLPLLLPFGYTDQMSACNEIRSSTVKRCWVSKTTRSPTTPSY